jgi:hypothetical protein
VRYYDDTLACDTIPDYRRAMLERFRFYTMTRIPERRREALKLGIQLYHASTRTRTPSLVNYIFALQNGLHIPKANRIPDTELYPNKKIQLRWLKNLWNRRNQDYPVDGVRTKIRELEHDLTQPEPILTPSPLRTPY